MLVIVVRIEYIGYNPRYNTDIDPFGVALSPFTPLALTIAV